MKSRAEKRLTILEQRIRPDPQNPPEVDPYRYGLWYRIRVLQKSGEALPLGRLPSFEAREVTDFEAYLAYYMDQIGVNTLSREELTRTRKYLDAEDDLSQLMQELERWLQFSTAERAAIRRPTEAELEADREYVRYLVSVSGTT